MKKHPTSRRRFLQLAAGAGLASGGTLLSTRAQATVAGLADADVVAGLHDAALQIEFDGALRSRLAQRRGGAPGEPAQPMTRWTAAETVLLKNGSRPEAFHLRQHMQQPVEDELGAGRCLVIVGVADGRLEKTIKVTLYDRYPGFAVYRVAYRNLGSAQLELTGWTNAALKISTPPRRAAQAEEFWSYCGSTHSDRRDWVQPVRHGFDQPNFMGMEASDYGGGTPIVDVWRRDFGLAVGHLELTPELVSLPVRRDADGVSVALTRSAELRLAPGETLQTYETFIAVHSGDYFAVLDAYRRLMGDRGVRPPEAPAAAYEPIWCAWGYERSCTTQLIEDTLPKVRELGLRWAVIDDGWQSNVGDWQLDRQKYPRGETDMRQLVASIRDQSLRPRLWWAPLAAAPGSDLLHDHTDLLLLDREGAVQNISWWNSFYLCPAYPKTIDYTLDLVRKFIGDWGFAGLKIDGQHLNGVAPCYNPAHHHARPEESVEKLQDFFQAVYRTALELNPEAVVELCPCGTSYSFFNMRSFNQAPASDPESSWQVRLKGKTLKALMGPSAAFAGDHVELSDGGDDFASTVGIGGIVSTKFTWPRDPKPKDSFLLTPEREILWRRWIALYNERLLPLGIYRGSLYDIGFDKPETHVVEKDGRFYYAFYAHEFDGSVPLRGLTASRYRVRDYFNDRDLGEVAGGGREPRLPVSFRGALLIEAIPA
jgi:alpha-galactosidase